MGKKEKVRFGLSECAVAFFKETSTDMAPEWESPVKIKGAVNFVAAPQNETVNFEADNIVYYTISRSKSVQIDLELALIPDEVLAKMFGWKIDADGALVEIVEGVPASFALLLQIENDIKARRTVYYNCTAAIPNVESGTGVSVKTTKLVVTAIPIMLPDGESAIHKSLAYSAENKEAYNSWYDEVYLPAFTAPAPMSFGVEQTLPIITQPDDSGETVFIVPEIANVEASAEYPAIDGMTIAQLREFAVLNEVDITGLSLKTDIIEALKNAGY